jgi:integrase
LHYIDAKNRLNAGAELVDIQALLGHESIATTQISPTSGRSGRSRWWGGCDALVGERQCLTSG